MEYNEFWLLFGNLTYEAGKVDKNSVGFENVYVLRKKRRD